jgi:hypothetical protein
MKKTKITGADRRPSIVGHIRKPSLPVGVRHRNETAGSGGHCVWCVFRWAESEGQWEAAIGKRYFHERLAADEVAENLRKRFRNPGSKNAVAVVTFLGSSLVKAVLTPAEIVERHGELWFEDRRKGHDGRIVPLEEPHSGAEIPCECEGLNQNCYRCAGSGYYRRQDAAPLNVSPVSSPQRGGEAADAPDAPEKASATTSSQTQLGYVEYLVRKRGAVMIKLENGERCLWKAGKATRPTRSFRPGQQVKVVTRVSVVRGTRTVEVIEVNLMNQRDLPRV